MRWKYWSDETMHLESREGKVVVMDKRGQRSSREFEPTAEEMAGLEWVFHGEPTEHDGAAA